MEDFVIDMVMPEWGNLRIPINPFTLMWATTKLESLTPPFKNRFVYKFHFQDYDDIQKQHIISRYLDIYSIEIHADLLSQLSKLCVAIPREIHNLIIQIRDFLISHVGQDETHLNIDTDIWKQFVLRSQIQEWWLTPLHRQYLAIIRQANRPLGLKTLAIWLGVHEQSVEQDIEPLLFKLGYIEKTAKWRIWIDIR